MSQSVADGALGQLIAVLLEDVPRQKINACDKQRDGAQLIDQGISDTLGTRYAEQKKSQYEAGNGEDMEDAPLGGRNKSVHKAPHV